jgi:N-methylhydantoinase B
MDGNLSSSQWYMGDLPMLWPVERGELSNPIRAVWSGLRPDSGGAGYRRGGVGIIRAWEILGDGQFSFLGSEGILPRPGMSAGYGGALNQLRVLRDGQELEVSEVPLKVGGFPLQPGDVIVTLAAGGAGYGDPLEREPDRVGGDVEDGYVSMEGALHDYGVVIVDGSVDLAATEARRRELRDAREYVVAAAADEDEFDDDGSRIVRISPGLAGRLGVGDGDLVELIPTERPTVKSWVRIDPELADDGTRLGPVSRQMCGVEDGERVWIRTPWTYAAGISELTEEFFAAHALVAGVPL